MVLKAQENGVEAGRIIRGSGPDCFYWFVPTMRPADRTLPVPRVKGIIVDQTLFADLLEHFNPRSNLTAAEIRAVFQVVAGYSLREAAALDGGSVETKRTQIKSACSKMQCSGQVDLVRTVIGQMFHLVSIADAEASHSEAVESFIGRHFPADVSVNVRRLSDGRLVTLLEAGPASGTPVIVVHGMMFGVMLPGVGEHLERAGLRAIIPIRPGYLESVSIGSRHAQEEMTRLTIATLADFIRESFGGPVPVLGHSLGAGLAIRFAAAHPELVSALVLLSTNLTQTKPSAEAFAGHLYTGLRDLGRYPGLCRLITWQFRKYYADVETCRGILASLFAACASDIDVLDGLTGAQPVPPWFSDLYASSVSGITGDFFFTTQQLPRLAAECAAPITVLHGANDPITRINEVRAILPANASHNVVGFEGAGHFLIASQPERAWDEVAGAARSYL